MAGVSEVTGAAGQEVHIPDLSAVWARLRDQVLDRIETIAQALNAAQDGSLDDELRQLAHRNAHMLSGSAGTFGFHLASGHAKHLEALFDEPLPFDAARLAHALDDLGALRAEIDSDDDAPVVADTAIRLFLLHHDKELCRVVETLTRARGLSCVTATESMSALDLLGDATPDVALIELDAAAEAADLIGELGARYARLPIVAIVSSASVIDRVGAVRAGARGFLPNSLDAAELVEAAVTIVGESLPDEGRVLAVDDDPAILAAIESLLRPTGLRVTTLSDPHRFWHSLEETAPDLVILDLDMPEINGTDLCRLLRADPRWKTLPVLFLTGSADADGVQEIFSAGADDYVSKPVVGPELLTRVTNRLERVRMLRSLADTDPLTGLANRRKLEQQWDRFRRLADRYNQPLSFAILDLDKFKRVNDSHGHAVGDAVLQGLGQMLNERFRANDIAARWGGEEMAVAMYGMTRSDGVLRLAETEDAFFSRVFETPSGESLQVHFSGGVVEYGRDGVELHDLYCRADEILYSVKASGGARVLSVPPSA
jgi:diguanylate cyclase (GGDEF)-like protein